MKRWLYFLASLVAIGGVVLVGKSRGQFMTMPKTAPTAQTRPAQPPAADVGPGEGGAQLRMPAMEEPARQPQPVAAPPSQPLPNQQVPAFVQQLGVVRGSNPSPGTPDKRVAQPPTPIERYAPYKHLEITDQHGAYAIFIMGYTNTPLKSAPDMGARFVQEIQTSPKFAELKQRACLFFYGAAEKQAEFERVEKIKQDRIEEFKRLYQNTDMKGKKTEIFMPTIRTVRIDEQTAVLLCGYRTQEEAELALERIKTLPHPDPQKVDMDIKYHGELERDRDGYVQINGAIQSYKDYDYVNPFKRAFVTRNPAVKHDGAGAMSREDVEYLKRVNSGEPLSLFACKHKYTLAVKQYATAFKTVDKTEKRSFLAALQPKLIGEWSDNAAHNAHNLADGLRKRGFPEAYVLHARNVSYVTVGGFDDLNDQRLAAAQQFLANRFRADDFRDWDMMPVPTPMFVPR